MTASASATSLVAGQSATLSWSATNASSVTVDNGIGSVSTTGTRSVSPLQTTTYNFTATGSGGSTTTAVTVSVTQPGPPTVTLSASPSTISAGASSSLAWMTMNATSVTIDNKIGSVASNGSMAVSPSATTTYTATATGLGGTATAPTTIVVAVPPPPNGTVSIPTWHMDNTRSGLNSNETQLTPANVNSASFGKLFSYLVDGYMYAQPLYVSNLTINGAKHNVVFAATEQASVYAFDADNFANSAPLWKVSLLQSGESPQAGGNPQPFQALTSTPVIELATNTMYLVSAQKTTGTPFFRLSALDITTGHQRAGSPVLITASAPGTNSDSVGGMIMLTSSCLQRASLLLAQGTLYLGFSACHSGWLLSYDAASLTQLGVLNTSPNVDGYGQFGGAGGIWMGGGGPAADDQGNVYVSTGNGFYDGGPEWGDSVLKLDSHLNAIDHFAPFDWAYLQCTDRDLSSGGVMLLPGQTQLLAGGKAGKMYLINTTNLGHMQAGDAGAAQTFWFNNNHGTASCVDNHANTVTGDSAFYSFYSTAAWFNGSAFIGTDPGPVRQFTLASGQFTAGAETPDGIGSLTLGTTPFISANGTSNGIVWMIDHGQPIQTSPTPTAAALRAYDAADITHELYNSTQTLADVPGFGIKFTSPIVANGKVFMGTAHDSLSSPNPQGELDVYGLRK
jgi:hypothetical protein